MYTSYPDIDFTGFEKREELKNVWRYNAYDDVWYRSQVWDHSIRLFLMILNCKNPILEIFPNIDFKKIQILSLVHDDTEMLIGDFQAGNRKHMTQEQLQEIDTQEEEAIESMRNLFPQNIEGYNYGDLLFEIYEKQTLEAQLVKFFDRIDALCDALHELFAGSDTMLQHAQNQYGTIILPIDYYIEMFQQAEKHYPKLKVIFYKKFDEYTPFELNFPRWDFENKVHNYSPHIPNSLMISTGYPLYEWRKEVILTSGDKKLIENLTTFSFGRYLKTGK